MVFSSPYKEARFQVRFITVRRRAFALSYLYSISDYRYHIIVITEGEVEVVDMEQVAIARRSQVCLLPAGYYIKGGGRDAKFWLLRFTEQYREVASFSANKGACALLNEMELQCLQADSFNFKVIKKLIMLLYKHQNYRKSPNSEIMCRLTFNLILKCFDELTATQSKPNRLTTKRKELVAIEFIRLAEKEAKDHHDVGYYADKLCMTQGNLTKIVRETIAKPPKVLIEEILVRMAKEILDNTSSPIYSVAEELNFKSSSAFINFFRTRTGSTPSEYRNRK